MSEYVPFGDEWKAEVMRLKKSEIVDMLAKALREQTSRPTMRALDETDLCDCANTRMSLVVGGICQVCQKPFRQ